MYPETFYFITIHSNLFKIDIFLLCANLVKRGKNGASFTMQNFETVRIWVSAEQNVGRGKISEEVCLQSAFKAVFWKVQKSEHVLHMCVIKRMKQINTKHSKFLVNFIEMKNWNKLLLFLPLSLHYSQNFLFTKVFFFFF